MGTRTPRPRQPSDNAAIARALATDSELLRYSEWWVRRRIYGLQDAEARWLYEQYRDAYHTMAGKLGSAYDMDGNPELARRAALLDQIEREMNALSGGVEQHLDNALVDAFRQGYAGRAWVLDSVTGQNVRVRYPLLPTEAVRALLLQDYLGRQWGETLGYDRIEFVTRIKRGLTNSMIQGEGMAAAQRRLRDELGIQTDRRKGFTRNFYRTLLITRTELMRASNLGAMAIYENNQDVLRGWEWVSTRDGRTCSRCGALDGKVFAFGDPQLAPPSGSHPGCRCTPVPVLTDSAIQNAVAGQRVTYAQWSLENGVMMDDGGLSGQTGADAHGLNTTSGQ